MSKHEFGRMVDGKYKYYRWQEKVGSVVEDLMPLFAILMFAVGVGIMALGIAWGSGLR